MSIGSNACGRLGLKGVEISTAINGLDVGNPAFARFWDKASELDCVVLIHPFGTSLGDRLDRCEKAKIVAAHGGGYLPTYIGRSPHDLVDAVAGLGEADRDAIFSGNALKLIGETRRSAQAGRSF